MSQGQVKQHGDNQMPIITADRVESTFKVGGGHGHTVGELHYQMVGLLVLQRLYADVLEEKRRLEDFYTKRELSYRLRDQLDSHDKNVDEDAAAISNIHGKSQVDENNSLFSPLYRSMSHPLTTYKQMIADGPNETVNGLLQVLATHCAKLMLRWQFLFCLIVGESRVKEVKPTPANSYRGIRTGTSFVPSNPTI
jgi:hypothetical protein